MILDLDVTWRGIFVKDAYSGGGAHGWDNLNKDMQAIFMAHGPSFKENTVVRPFENIQVYNLICALVNVTPADNNGTWGALHNLLVDPPMRDMDSSKEFQKSPSIMRMQADMIKGTEVHVTVCGSIKNEVLLDEFSSNVIHVNTTQEREMELLLDHAPLGVPVGLLKDGSRTTNLLVNEDYLIGFDKELGMPVWTSYTITNLTNDRNNSNEGQWIQDPRLSAQERAEYCERIGNESNSSEVHLNHAFPKEFASRAADVWLSTNVLEVPSHMTPVIKTMTRLLMKASANHKNLNIISGPTSHHSPALFYVVTTCLDSERNSTDTCPIEFRELQAFLLPIRQRLNGACLSNEDFIALNVASLKDVERLTDLKFFPHLSIEEKTDLLTRTVADSKLVVQAARS